MKTKRKTKDLDEVQEDMKPGRCEQLLRQKLNYEMPGNAQFYCIHCARYFVDNKALQEHYRGKPHKQQLKALATEAYTQEEAERAAGMGSHVTAKKRKLENFTSSTMDSDDVTVKKKK